MVKTDRCVSLLAEIQFWLNPSCFELRCNDELAEIIKEADNKGNAIRQYVMDKSGRDIFLTDEEAVRMIFDKNAIFRYLAFLKALAIYVLHPVVKCSNKDEFLEYVDNCVTSDPFCNDTAKKIVIETVRSHWPPLFIKELEDEFMDVCPDVDSIGPYLVMARAKYNGLSFPFRNNDLRFVGAPMLDFVYKDSVSYRDVRKAESVGLITRDEAESILACIWQVIFRVNMIADWIVEMYAKIESFIPLNEANNANQTGLNARNTHFSVSKSYEEMQRILTALQQQGFISTNTTIETFYYRMTGQGTPTSNKIEWIKKGRRNNSLINKRSLVYFVEMLTKHRVSKTQACTNQIEDIFGLSLSSSTINSTAICEYKAEIDKIVGAEQ